jgi:hypothetical protein
MQSTKLITAAFFLLLSSAIFAISQGSLLQPNTINCYLTPNIQHPIITIDVSQPNGLNLPLISSNLGSCGNFTQCLIQEPGKADLIGTVPENAEPGLYALKMSVLNPQNLKRTVCKYPLEITSNNAISQ